MPKPSCGGEDHEFGNAADRGPGGPSPPLQRGPPRRLRSLVDSLDHRPDDRRVRPARARLGRQRAARPGPGRPGPPLRLADLDVAGETAHLLHRLLSLDQSVLARRFRDAASPSTVGSSVTRYAAASAPPPAPPRRAPPA